MALFFRPEDRAEIVRVYETLPDPKPSLDDFYTYVFETGGITSVKTRDLRLVSAAALGAEARADRRKYLT